MKNDLKYIIKKIIIGVGIIFVITFINSCKVHALSYSLSNKITRINMYGAYVNNIKWGTSYWRGVAWEQYTGFDSKVELISTADIPVIFEGRYLISFILFSNHNTQDLNCNNITSTFKNVNMITGNWVQNEISSKCIDMYSTTYNGKPAWRLLYDFTYKSSNAADSITELQFIVTSKASDGYKFFQGDQYGLDIGLDISDIQDYEISIIDTWNNNKQNQSIISNGNTLINQNQTIINQNTSINNSINDVNNSINDSSIDSADSKANEWASKTLSDGVVSQMVTMPITLMQSYLNGINGSCSQFSLGTLYEHELILPCINLSDYFGSNLWNVIDILFSGFMIYAIGRKFVRIFNDFTNLRDNQVDELYGGGN